jgi:hypothetical protein
MQYGEKKKEEERGEFFPVSEAQRALVARFTQLFRTRDDPKARPEDASFAVRRLAAAAAEPGAGGHGALAHLLDDEIRYRGAAEGPAMPFLSLVLTALAEKEDEMSGHHLTYLDAGRMPREEPSEKLFAHAGRIVAELARSPSGAKALAVWCTDLSRGAHFLSGRLAVEPRPVTVIRGIFLSHHVRQERMAAFWAEATRLPEFPWHMFSEPCWDDEGVIFSDYHAGAIALVVTHAGPDVRERVIRQLCAVTHRRVRMTSARLAQWHGEGHRVPVRRELQEEVVPATAAEIHAALMAVTDRIADTALRAEVRALLGL